MKLKYQSMITLGLICFSSIVMANQVVLLNTSKTGESIRLTYKIAHKKGQTVKYEPETAIALPRGETYIPVELDGYQFAGIVPVSANGHILPPEVTQFDRYNKKCVAITDKHKTIDRLVFAVDQDASDHKMTCSS